MRVAVIGAGVVGVTTAFELAVDGHEVTIFERHSAAAEEASFANAGFLAPGDVIPWAAPGLPGRLSALLWSRHRPAQIRWPLSAREAAWLWRWWRSCEPEHHAANRLRLHQLAVYSRARLQEITEHFLLEYDRSQGLLLLLRTERERKQVQAGLGLLKEAGVTFVEIDAEQARVIEPAISADTQFAGAIHWPGDEVANCRQFALQLKQVAQARGIRFEFNSVVEPLDPVTPGSLRVWPHDAAAPDQWNFNAVVVCAGVDSARLLRPLGVRLPLTAVYGYSISAPIRDPLHAPRSGVMDEHHKVMISRIGNRVRVAGASEIGGLPTRKHPDAIQTLYRVLHDWFPGAARLGNSDTTVQEWKGARPALPDGPPLIGATGVPGIWMNLGHGSSGWALACGSARVLADLVSGQQPEIDVQGFGLDRLSRL